jgi:hypothetical protein
MSDSTFVALMLAPTALLTLSAIYLAVKVRGPGAWLVAAGSTLALILGIAEAAAPKRGTQVFDSGGNLAGAIFEGGGSAMLLLYGGSVAIVLMAVGLVLLAKTFSRSTKGAVSPNKSFERTREG